jgi:hypothetical protein
MTDHRSPRWLQLSLQSLFGLTLLVATFSAGYALRAKQDEATVRRYAWHKYSDHFTCLAGEVNQQQPVPRR